METIITAIIVIYCIIVLFIMIEKKIDAMPKPQTEVPIEDDWEDDFDSGWFDFAAGLTDMPSSTLPCRPLEK